jgi:flagellar biosynthesis/type III secretory pathway protein FliH
MSGIIKSLDRARHGEIRPLARPSQPPQEDEQDRLRARIAQLETEMRQRDQVQAGLRADIDAALLRGKDEGRAAGLREAEDRQAARLALLEKNLRDARARMDEGFASLERLAVLVAEECLDTILGERKYRAGALRKIVAKQLAGIEKSALLAIELSSIDFADAEALAAVESDVASSKVAVSASAEIAPGGCRMTLRLGRMDVGIDRQWGTLRTVLGEIAAAKDVR